MDWIREWCNSDSHPQIRAAGFWGSTVFRFLCRLSGAHKLKGTIPPRYQDPGYIEHMLGLDMDDRDRGVIKRGISDAIKAGLIRVEGGNWIIDGWDRKQRGADLSTDRVRAYRARKTDEPQNELFVAPEKPARAPRKDPPALAALKWINEERAKVVSISDEPVPMPRAMAGINDILNEIGGDGLRASYRSYLADDYAKSASCPLRLFLSQWRRFSSQQRIERSSAPRIVKPGEDLYNE